MLAIKFIPLLVAIACIWALEQIVRPAFGVDGWRMQSFRLQYPLWVGVALRSMPGLEWITWAIAPYSIAMGILALRLADDIRLVAQIQRDFQEYRREREETLRLMRKVQQQRQRLKETGCPAGLDCDAMGRDRLGGCYNFEICQRMPKHRHYG